MFVGVLSISLQDRCGLRRHAPEPRFNDLVEAERHLAMGDGRRTQSEVESEEGWEAQTSPTPNPRACGERRSVEAGRIRRYLATGWARIADEEDRVLFWHPDKGQFVPFTYGDPADGSSAEDSSCVWLCAGPRSPSRLPRRSMCVR